jgi:vacuolar-type H+-ATPase subunit I/STV1
MNRKLHAEESVKNERMIRYVLLANGFSTGVVGLILIFLSHFVATLTGLDRSSALVEVGIFLVVFVAFVFWTVKLKFIPPGYVLIFSVVDFLWVIGSVLLITTNETMFLMTYLGIWAVSLVALVVGVFAIFEFNYWWVNRSLKRSSD